MCITAALHQGNEGFGENNKIRCYKGKKIKPRTEKGNKVAWKDFMKDRIKGYRISKDALFEFHFSN